MFGLLVAISVGAFLMTFRTEGRAKDPKWHEELADFRRLLGTSWAMVVTFWIGWAAGHVVATLLFAAIAFFALREFITLSPTRRGDHRSLVDPVRAVLAAVDLLQREHVAPERARGGHEQAGVDPPVRGPPAAVDVERADPHGPSVPGRRRDREVRSGPA